MTNLTITLPTEHWQRINDALTDCCDNGPPGQGWKSQELSAAIAALDVALSESEPVGPAIGVLLNTPIDNRWYADLNQKHQPERISITNELFGDLIDYWVQEALSKKPYGCKYPTHTYVACKAFEYGKRYVNERH